MAWRTSWALTWADLLLAEDLLAVANRRRVAARRRRLAFEAGDPLISPVGEGDVLLKSGQALVHLNQDLVEGALGLVAITADALALDLSAARQDHVVGRTRVGAGAALGCFTERGPDLAEPAFLPVTRLNGGHQSLLRGRTIRPPRGWSSTSSTAPFSHAASSSGRNKHRRPPGRRRCGISQKRVSS